MNTAYASKVGDFKQIAKNTTRDTGNSFFRALQLLSHLREGDKQKNPSDT
jgi:hypothetical protein